MFSTYGGITPLSAMTLSFWANGEAGSAIPVFELVRVRSGVEAALASARVSREVRGHLHSHGLTGVQARDFDGYDYLREKREARDVLFGLLQGKHVRVRPRSK